MDVIPPDLRTQFIRSLERKVQEMEVDLEGLSKDPTQPKAFASVLSKLHDLAGTGTMYGFPEVTALGREGEAAGNRAAREGVSATPLVSTWRSILEGLKAELRRSRGDNPDGAAE